jgi:hypothetical protein
MVFEFAMVFNLTLKLTLGMTGPACHEPVPVANGHQVSVAGALIRQTEKWNSGGFKLSLK